MEDTTEHQERIDSLLERYLTLLNDYSALHASLAPLHGNMYQAIARANFSADRGIRYGQDYYDDRMQAARRLAFDAAVGEEDVVNGNDNAAGDGQDSSSSSGSGGGSETISKLGWTCCVVDVGVVDAEDAEVRGSNEGNEGKDNEGKDNEGKDNEGKDNEGKDNEGKYNEGTKENVNDAQQKGKPARDPISWFGFMAPHALREAQAQAAESVTKLVPRLAVVVAEMREVEIEIRRARKRRAKAEAAVGKEASLVSKAKDTTAAAAAADKSTAEVEVEAVEVLG